jgi:hypothetical protein
LTSTPVKKFKKDSVIVGLRFASLKPENHKNETQRTLTWIQLLMRKKGTSFENPSEVGVEKVNSEYYAGGNPPEAKLIDGTRPEDEGLGTGAIIGIVVGVLVVVAVVVIVIVLVMKKKNGGNTIAEEE